MTAQYPSESPGPGTPRFTRVLFNVLFASVGYVAIRFLIAPIRIKLLTSLLSKEDYGLLTLIMLTVSFITLISSLGSLEFMLRKLPGRDAAYQFQTLRTVATYFGILAGIIGVAGVCVLVAWQPETLGLRPSDLIAVALILVFTVHLIQLVFFLMARSQYAQSRLLMLLYADAWFLPILGFMWYIELTVSFMLWLWVVWLALSIVFSQVYVRTRELLRHAPSRNLLRRILTFGVPLLPMIMGEWIFQVQDRYVLLAFTDLEAVANFTLCFNIAWVGVATGTSMLDLLITEFYKARNRVASSDFNTLVTNESLRRSFTMLLRYGLVLSTPIVLALWFAGLPIILLLSDPKFADAAYIMRWVAPLPLLYLMVVVAGRTLMAVDRGGIVGVGTLCAAGLHLVLAIILAPLLAERGVALAGCLAYGVLAIYLGGRVRLLRWINWKELRPYRLIAFIVVSAAGWHIATTSMESRTLPVLLLGGMISLAAMFGLGLLRKTDIQQIRDSMQVPPEPEEPFPRD